MSDNRPKEITDPTEQAVWDNVVGMIVESAGEVHRIQFNKYKLRYHMTTNDLENGANNSLNSKNSLTKISDRLENMVDSFHQNYLQKTKKINDMQVVYNDRPRIGIMLETAQDNLKKILTYEQLNAPTFANLKNKILMLDADALSAQALSNDANIQKN